MAVHHILLDSRFPILDVDQKHAILHIYKHDRQRGWGIADARYYVNAVVDHAMDHRQNA